MRMAREIIVGQKRAVGVKEPTRFDAGTYNLFNVSGATQTDDPGLNAVTSRASLPNGSVGAQGSLVAFTSTIGSPTTKVTGAASYMQALVNGTSYYIQLCT